MMKKWFAGVLGALLLLGSWGFAAEGKPEIVLGASKSPGELAPLEQTDDLLTSLVFDTLFVYNLEGKPEPLMADRYEISDDYRTYTLHLKDGLLWHDGQKVTAADVLYTFEAAKTGNPRYRRLAGFVAGVQAKDEQTVEIRLNDPRPNWIAEALCILPIVPAHGQGEDRALPVGSGGYQVQECVPGRQYVLTAVEGYALGEPSVGKITVRVAADNQGVIDGLVSRAFDASLYPVGVEGRGQLVNQPLTVTENTTFQTVNLLMNQKGTALSDVRVRKAVEAAIDVNVLRDQVYSEKATVASSGFFNSVIGYAQLNMKRGYDPEQANRLLDEAGYGQKDGDGTRQGLRFTLAVRNSEEKALGEKISEYLRACGISVTVEEREELGSFDLALYTTDESLQRDESALLTLAGKDGIYNFGGYESQAFEAAAQEYQGLVDPEKRLTLIHSMQTIVADEAAFIPLVYPMAIDCYGKQNYSSYVTRQGGGIMNRYSFYENSKTMVEAANNRQNAGDAFVLNPLLVGGIILAISGLSVAWLYHKTKGEAK